MHNIRKLSGAKQNQTATSSYMRTGCWFWCCHCRTLSVPEKPWREICQERCSNNAAWIMVRFDCQSIWPVQKKKKKKYICELCSIPAFQSVRKSTAGGELHLLRRVLWARIYPPQKHVGQKKVLLQQSKIPCLVWTACNHRCFKSFTQHSSALLGSLRVVVGYPLDTTASAGATSVTSLHWHLWGPCNPVLQMREELSIES